MRIIMKIPQHRQSSFLIVVLTALLVILNAFLRIPSTEGFNPSDDGVVLAQSYRLLQGEIPHRDFISIRPVGSAVMHLIHFFSPLPLELSARWMTLAEYFLYSLLISLILIRVWFNHLSAPQRNWLLAGSVVFMFILNENHYNLFPWTTIDALFWFSLALYAWYRLRQPGLKREWLWIFILFWGISSSVLSRQTFALPGVFLGVMAIVWLLRHPQPGRAARILSLAAGLLPGLSYAAMITISGSWPEFISQMTGRTEFWQTGIEKFTGNFWQTPVWPLFIATLLTGLVITWNREQSLTVYRTRRIPDALQWLAGILIAGLSASVFIFPEHLFNISFSLFWLLLLQLIVVYLREGTFPGWLGPAIWILLVSWTSALSLGDNAPVFSTGLLAGTGLLLTLKTSSRPHVLPPSRPPVLTSSRSKRIWSRLPGIAGGIAIPALLVLSLIVQKNINYRDLPAKQLTRDLGEIYPGLEGIRSSPKMYEYLSEIKRLYVELGSPSGRFAVWPNNALIYTLLDSPDPFPLDWMQAAEFAGNEERIMKETENILLRKDIVVLVERYNVKWIASSEVPVERTSADYPFLDLLYRYAVDAGIESPWFFVYRTK